MINRYTNKFVQFLSNSNTIQVANERDYNDLQTLTQRVNLDLWQDLDYTGLKKLAKFNNCLIDGHIILIEYSAHKGFTFGYGSLKDSEEWYGMEPWTMDEIREELD